MRRSLAFVLTACMSFACSDDGSESKGTGGASGAGGASGSGGSATGGVSGSGGTAGAGAGGSSGTGGGTLGPTFRHGINGGHRNPAFGDDVQADLEAAAGCDSQRISLPEAHLDKWGYDIEVSDMQHYASVGMKDQVAFLTSPIRAHSTAPASAADWELVHYLPKNLYEPITLASGQVNPNNYWAKYVFDTVSQYKTWIKVWEIWNEPDWVSDYKVTSTWSTSPPLAKDLPRFNGSIYEYVRLLRVSSVAAKLADPDAKIATGGLGYPAFLGALLRYTDNPQDGSVDGEYPEKGGAYFDVLSTHYYPNFTPGSSDAGVQGFLDQHAKMQAELDQAKKSVVGFEVTESGASHVVVSGTPSGSEYARSYLVKVMASAQRAGVHGIDWFVLSDAALPGASTDAFAFMGLYEDLAAISAPAQAKRTETGVAYATLKKLLAGAKFDAQADAALALPADVGGVALSTASGKPGLVLWAKAQGTSESASASYSLVTSASWLSHAWDHALTGASEEHAPTSGEITLALTSSPLILVQK